MKSIGEVDVDLNGISYPVRFEAAEQNDVRCPDQAAAEKMRAHIEEIIHAKDTLGGVLEIVALNVPVGLGSFSQWEMRLEARLAMAVMSVQAIKGVEVGDAFENAKRLGTHAHDSVGLNGRDLIRSTNRGGGIEGGISNGQPIVISRGDETDCNDADSAANR